MIYQQRRLWHWSLALTLVMLGLYGASSILLAERSFTGCGGEHVVPTNITNEQRIVELVNTERAAQELPPMKLYDSLTDAARYHAADMSQDDYFAHQTHDRQDGVLTLVCDWTVRIHMYYPGTDALAEIMAVGDLSPEDVVAGWMSNSEHRANILGHYREIGVGYDDPYWVQNLAERADSYPVVINREAQQTDSPAVTLYIYGDWQQMRLRNNAGSWGEWQVFRQELDWTLDSTIGEQQVEVEVSNGTMTVLSSDTIWLTAVATPQPTAIPSPFPTTPATNFLYLPAIQR